MSDLSAGAVPEGFELFRDPLFSDPDAPNRPNRLCVCFSDIHLTDGTVGNQSADAVIWREVFDDIADICVDSKVRELTLLICGDFADVIRSAQWSQNGVYPWERNHPKFIRILREVVGAIVRRHALEKSETGDCGFFHLLRCLPDKIKEGGGGSVEEIKIRTLVLLGNHDKEMLADSDTLKMIYEECLGQPIAKLSPDYRRWIGRMYFGDEKRFQAPDSVPWLPFYWGDRGFRFFVTHGQWRDKDNSRRIEAKGGKLGWKAEDGWRPDVWRALGYAPFIEACFGDTVAAGVLSGFIYRTKKRLSEFPNKTAKEEQELSRLLRILDELDLYRPTAAAVKRIIEETRRLRGFGANTASATKIIEEELLSSIRTWLQWDFTLESASPGVRLILRIAKPVVFLLERLGARIELTFIDGLMSFLTVRNIWRRHEPSYDEMKSFPAFLKEYRQYGFRIYAEGHTHKALEDELHFEEPTEPPSRRNYSYINFGTWRDNVVSKKHQGYRRRSIGRMLAILDEEAAAPGSQRKFTYWAQDVVIWGDKADLL